MSGKQHKRELKRAKIEAREAARRRERQRSIQTAIVVAIIVAIGGVLVFVSARDDAADVADAGATPSPGGSEDALAPESGTAAVDAEPCVPEPAPENALTEGGEPKQTYDAPEQVLEEGTDYRAVIATTCGEIVFDLFESDAPETVNSFVFLAQEGFFDGLSIFRNSPGIAILQTGAGDDTNTWDLGYTIPDEFARAEADGAYSAGALAMANSGTPDSGGSQFFMVYGDSSLPPQYTLYGEVVEGLDVLQSIGAIPVEDGTETPSEIVYMESVTIETGSGGAGAASEAESGTATAPSETTSEQ